MNTKENTNLQGHVKTTKERGTYEILKEWLNELKIYDSKIVYFIVLLMGFGLYTIAYVFLYGFYFGRESNNVMSVIQVVINPVPFNFKSLTMLGLFLVILLAGFISILHKIADSLKRKSKLIIFDLIILVVLNISTQVAITLVFIGKYNLSVKYLDIWIFLSLIIIYFALVVSGKGVEIVYAFIGDILISVITLFVFAKFKVQVGAVHSLSMFISVWLLLAILLVYINLRRLIINCLIYIVTYFSVIAILKINLISYRSLLAVIIILSLLITINFLMKKNYLYIRRIINNKNKIKKQKNKNNKLEKHVNNILVELTAGRYKFIIVPIYISISILASYYLIFTLGKDTSKNMLETSYDIISYKPNGINPLRGIVVSHSDNVFYISNEKKELIMIKKNSDVNIIPH